MTRGERVFAGAPRVLPFVFVAIASASIAHAGPPGPLANEASAAQGYAGSNACRTCHAKQFESWTGSDHDRAMQTASAATVLGDFRDASLEADGVSSKFSTKDGRYVVRTEGPDGASADYEVKYTFGVRPLQQYLVEFPGGRLQPLRQAWDSRPKEKGGQRWFQLYAGERIAPGDQLHWTGLYQNWNLQCASCHSTNLRKGYDAKSQTYATTWSERNVACESCHGPATAHVEWAGRISPPYREDDTKGFRFPVRRSPAEAWKFASAGARYASVGDGAAARRANAEARMNTCAPCHSRRAALTETATPGAPLESAHRLQLPVEPFFFPDGQQREEDYTWASFLQSRMYARGVTCDDCHDPHSLELRAVGNGTCAQCHDAAAFDTKAHHFHEPGTPGASCVQCHMPSRNYMEIDARHDHSLRVPRPDLSARLASPDACTSCHVGKTPQWAADAMDRWYGAAWRTRKEYGSTLRRAATEGDKSVRDLLALARDAEAPAIVRATAAELAAPRITAPLAGSVPPLLADPQPLVRMAATDILERFPPEVRTPAAAAMTGDASLAVRIEAAHLLAGIGDDKLTGEQAAARAKAKADLLASLESQADWPSSVASLANFELREGRTAEAVATYERAIRLDPHFAAAYVNLADAHRLAGRDDEGEAVLRRGLAAVPDSAGIHQSLGLLLVRKGDKERGTEELGKAAALDPADARAAYVYAVALHSTGKVDEAIAVLAESDARHAFDVDTLSALVSMNLEAGRSAAALPWARKIREAVPDDTGVRELISRLESQPGR